MNDFIELRLETLALEQQKGRDALAELDDRRARLTETLLRIEGAMAVLREMQATESSEQRGGIGPTMKTADSDDDAPPGELLRQVAP